MSRNSPPYMHNGALATLADVISFCNDGGGEHPNKSELMQPLNLSDQEIEDFVVFLAEALQGTQRQAEFPENLRGATPGFGCPAFGRVR